ncbi:putative protein kish [Rosa chinensis]|uniref:Uncharacterized protein n=1 Tax=Rosa chinensis TaxID=74649 RepID=A0A2P6Q797_ROSCH|nr:putative protein kish [Rosa chinensis]
MPMVLIEAFQVLWRFYVAWLMLFNAFGILNEERFLSPRGYTMRHSQLLAALRERDFRGRRDWRRIIKAALILILNAARFLNFLLIGLNTICIVTLLLFNSTIIKFNLYFAVVLLTITLCTYLKMYIPKIFEERKPGFEGIPWKAARIGERLSPWIAAGCLISSISIMFTFI